MNVSYDCGIGHRGRGPRGRKQTVNWRFAYRDMRCVLPAVYRFPQGIVFDIFSFADEARLRAFFARHQPLEATPTSVQRRCAEQEHPFQPVPIREIRLNGQQTAGDIAYSHTVSIPWAQQNEELEPLRRAFPRWLNAARPFACQRVCVDYPTADRGMERLLRRLRLNRIRGMELVAAAAPWFYPLEIRFELSSANTDRQLDFINPATGTAHRLYLGKTEIQELPLGPHASRKLYAMLAVYKIDPALPEGSALSFASSLSYAEPAQDAFSPTATSSAIATTVGEPEERGLAPHGAAAAFGIIGGADGPTALFLGRGRENRQPQGPHGLPWHSCLSAPDWVKKASYAFVLDGISARHTPEQVLTLGDQ